LDRTEIDRWLQAYVQAWKSYDRDQIAALFTEDVTCRYHPYDDPIVGRDEVVASWLGEGDQFRLSECGRIEAWGRDEEGTYEASYRTVAVDGQVAVATGSSTYLTEPGGAVKEVYDNCFVMRFEAERCSEFTEWFMRRPS
jgi:ketosteroid isomerase-like protein